MKTAHGQITKLAAVLMAASIDSIAEDPSTKTRKSSPEPVQILISIPDRKLALVQGDQVLKLYDVAVGKSSTPTPEGKFVVINRIPNPTWYGPQGAVPPGKNNPIGTRWMGLSKEGYGIHGTNAPLSIGKAASHGCIRMRQQDLEELFDLIPVGTQVEIETVAFAEMEPPEFISQVMSVSNDEAGKRLQ